MIAASDRLSSRSAAISMAMARSLAAAASSCTKHNLVRPIPELFSGHIAGHEFEGVGVQPIT